MVMGCTSNGLQQYWESSEARKLKGACINCASSSQYKFTPTYPLVGAFDSSATFSTCSVSNPQVRIQDSLTQASPLAVSSGPSEVFKCRQVALVSHHHAKTAGCRQHVL